MRYKPLLYDKRVLDELYDILMILVTGRAYVYAMNDWGETVSDVAFENGYRDIWIRVLEDCGYDIEVVLSYRKGPNVPRPTQRSKLPFKEYCKRRASSSISSHVVGVSEIDLTNFSEVCLHGPLCNGPLCRLKTSAIAGDRWNCAECHKVNFCANCEAFNRLIQFSTSDGKCGNANAKSGEIKDDQQNNKEDRHELCENGNFQNDLLGIDESQDDATIGIDHDDENFGPQSNIDLENLEFDAQLAESEERDFMEFFVIDDWA
jgi:hypothetical protein